MATGVISGAYAPEEHRIDIRRLVEEGGGSFVEGRITEIRTENREFVLEDGSTVPYDAASVCLGSELARSGVEQHGAGAVGVKPVANTVEIRRRLLAHGEDRAARILVVGGGVAGCEVAANTLALLGRLGLEGELTIAQKGDSLLPDAPKRAQKEILAFLQERGAKVLTGALVTRLGDGVAWTSDSREIPCDLPVLAVGVSPRRCSATHGSPPMRPAVSGWTATCVALVTGACSEEATVYLSAARASRSSVSSPSVRGP